MFANYSSFHPFDSATICPARAAFFAESVRDLFHRSNRLLEAVLCGAGTPFCTALLGVCNGPREKSTRTRGTALFLDRTLRNRRRGPDHSLFAMLRAYLDESGIHGGAFDCVVAGFVARAYFCDDLHVAWGHLLKEFHLREFHAKHFQKRQNQFKGWDAVKVERFRRSAIEVIRRCLRGELLSTENPISAPFHT